MSSKKHQEELKKNLEVKEEAEKLEQVKKKLQLFEKSMSQLLDISWEWEDDNGNYIRYPKSFSDQLEKAKIGEKVHYTFSKFRYEVTKMTSSKATQLNLDTAKQRTVQRVESPKSEYPSWWSSTSNNKSEVYLKIDMTHPDVLKAVTALKKSLGIRYTIVNGFFIQNKEIWKHHSTLYSTWLTSGRISEKTANVQMLWHGTSGTIVEEIAHKGFLRDLNSQHMYGKGVYFAKDCSYVIANDYAKFDNSNDCAELLYCRVICGESVVGKQTYVRPPDKGHVVGVKQEYETMVDSLYNPSIFVVCNDHQSYPVMKFIIKKKF